MSKALTKATKKRSHKRAAPPVAAALRLNLGAGQCPMEGYVNLDRKDGQEVYPLSYGDGTVDEIRASHVLEHFGHEGIGAVLRDWVRALKPGGRLKIAVPDFRAVALAYIAREPIDVQGYIMGGHVDDDDYHGALFDRETLHEALAVVGLERIGPWQSDAADCSSLPISLNLMGFKPVSTDARIDRVSGVLASARYGPSLHHECVRDSFRALGIDYVVRSGCFWHEILSEAMENELENPTLEYLITGDFDSAFRRDDVMELYRLMRAYPEADAICPVQMKRGPNGDPLFSINGSDGQILTQINLSEFECNVKRIHTGHFGLTIFRSAKLRAFKRPWMTPKPNAEGRWRDGNINADIDFWRNWEKAGNTLYLANKVLIGHLEDVLKWPGKDFKPVYQDVADYIKHGIPAEVVR